MGIRKNTILFTKIINFTLTTDLKISEISPIVKMLLSCSTPSTLTIIFANKVSSHFQKARCSSANRIAHRNEIYNIRTIVGKLCARKVELV